MKALEIINLSKTFFGKESIEVIRNLNFEAADKEFVCILGPSGCGKTILLWLIAGFEKPTQGKIISYNKEVTNISRERQVIFQEHALFPWKSAIGNIIIALEHKFFKKDRLKKLALNYLDLVGLKNFSNWPIYKLSGGMQQRIAVARALAAEPKILLMDEPFGALDVQTKIILGRELIKIWQETKKTVLFVTHSVAEAVYLADKIVILTALPAQIKDIIEINLPRPRNRDGQDFRRLISHIRNLIKEEVEKTYQAEKAGKLIELTNLIK